MLETQVVTVPRDVTATPRRAERSLSMSPAAAPSPYRTAEPAPTISTRPSRKRNSTDRLLRSEARLLMVAGAGATIFCAILVIYLAAYARVTNLGLAQSSARVHLHQLKQENETLRAQLAQVQNPDRIVAHATTLGMMTSANQVCYITRDGQAVPANTNMGERLPGVTSSGANSVNIASASFGH
ncbi:MAG: hypothetical protein JWQ02_4066 [Capsulimonas sp.]|nr:hypothetical protein [Capsulimonas sp.]